MAQAGTSGMPEVVEKMDYCNKSSLNARLNRPDALELLQILCLLPAGVSRDYISIWTGTRSLLPLSILRDRVLLAVL
jgi:hypothetical protein